MMGSRTLTAPRVAGALLASSFFVFLPGGLLFWARNGMAEQPAPNFGYFALERGFVMAAAAITTLGLALLAALVAETHRDAAVPARLVAAISAIAVVPLFLGEASLLRDGRFTYALIVAYVVPTFLSQAAFGLILIRAGFLPTWIGRAASGWNLAWPLLLLLLTPRNIYFPVLHHVIPLVIGIALLRRG